MFTTCYIDLTHTKKKSKFKNKKQIKQNKTNNKNNVLVLIPFVVEHSEGNDEEDEYGVGDVDGEPEVLHREREFTRAVVDRVAARLAVRHVGGEHQNRNGGD